MTPALLGLLACSPEPLPETSGQVAARAWLDGAVTAEGGVLVVQLEYAPECSVDVPAPEVAGLQFALAPDTVPPERVGRRVAHTLRYSFSGSQGSYEIPSLTGSWSCGDETGVVGTAPLFVDMGVAPPRPGELADIEDPWPVWTNLVPTRVIGFVSVLAGFLLGGVVLALRLSRRGSYEEVPEEPPDVLALRRWEAVRSDASLDDHDKALHLSRIFREYTEVVLSFPATSWTTSEILAHLKGLPLLPKGNVPRAKRLLRATDLVKFAEHDPQGDFFDDLEADLRGFVDSTRPHTWEAS